jgi:WD40 repeat-containing protein SMU1
MKVVVMMKQILMVRIVALLSGGLQDKFMMHAESVFCVNFNKDSELLVTGSQDGQVKVWRMATGKSLRKFEKAHVEGVTCVCFADDSSHILSGSFDHTVR